MDRAAVDLLRLQFTPQTLSVCLLFICGNTHEGYFQSINCIQLLENADIILNLMLICGGRHRDTEDRNKKLQKKKSVKKGKSKVAMLYNFCWTVATVVIVPGTRCTIFLLIFHFPRFSWYSHFKDIIIRRTDSKGNVTKSRRQTCFLAKSLSEIY